ncbi:hypothetical protein SCB71_09015 [Herbiconiux sp. KACC 21604]|uniref:hypothetical protein n=1 Tax=unclassified Herbiconiux TaxID=2618217 RepID=UPI001490A034|nr:hypothetical protein [Herbiconiux sp. SALV-R1]QJU53396.1 hypothetical protein HL652_06975 [Herbiconiux sp. SALV-R1]WPO88361.1 hypothetical protein SCB71_09015 [Herbiconiux sp. KACC 21604]
MRSSDPVPGNPWPHEMVLSIDDFPSALHELLWVREAWGLDVHGDDLPPLLTHGPARLAPADASAPAAWASAWPVLWRAALDRIAHVVGPDQAERMRGAALAAADESVGFDDALALIDGPNLRESFGDSAFTSTDAASSWEAWQHAHRQTVNLRRPLLYEETPEWVALPALVPAWKAGLEKIVLIPCRGDFTRRLGASALLVTESTRHDPLRYVRALRSFAG